MVETVTSSTENVPLRLSKQQDTCSGSLQGYQQEIEQCGAHIGTHRPRSFLSKRRFSLVLLIIPVAVIHRFAVNLPTTTGFVIFQSIACRIWYNINDPTAFPGSPIPRELCTTSATDKYYAALISILSTADGIGSQYPGISFINVC